MRLCPESPVSWVTTQGQGMTQDVIETLLLDNSADPGEQGWGVCFLFSNTDDI